MKFGKEFEKTLADILDGCQAETVLRTQEKYQFDHYGDIRQRAIARIQSAMEQADSRTFAKVGWTAEDILDLRENWTKEQAEDFLQKNERRIKDRLIEKGNEMLEDLLPPEEEAHTAIGSAGEAPGAKAPPRRTRTTFAP